MISYLFTLIILAFVDPLIAEQKITIDQKTTICIIRLH